MNEHLVEALLRATLFLETSSLEECDPVLAVRLLAAIGADLRQMPDAEQQQFRTIANGIANSAGSDDLRQELRDLVDYGLLPAAA
jgi:hypothetical protein